MPRADTSIRKISVKLLLLLMFDEYSVERSLTILSDLKDCETFLDFSQTLLRNYSYISTGNHWLLPWTLHSAIITGCLKQFTWPQFMLKDSFHKMYPAWQWHLYPGIDIKTLIYSCITIHKQWTVCFLHLKKFPLALHFVVEVGPGKYSHQSINQSMHKLHVHFNEWCNTPLCHS